MPTKQLLFLLLLFSSGFNFLVAQDFEIAENDTTPIETDSVWHIDGDFLESLIIPSYEELLESYFEAVVEVDKRLNFNPYRFQPSNTETVNPFVFDNIILPHGKEPNLENYQDGFKPKDAFENDAQAVIQDSRVFIANSNPDLITTTWNQMPDPPETKTKVDMIRSDAIDLDRMHPDRRRISGPQTIEKQNYIYHPWNVKIVSTFNANQTAFSHWASGGSNSFSLSGRIVTNADYTSYDKKKCWDNDIDLRLGYLQQEETPFVKNLDLFDINSQFSLNAVNKWYYAVSAEFKSQFFNGYDIDDEEYDEPISAFLAPAYIKVAVGMDYKYTKKDNKLLSIQASPLSYKITYVRDTVKINQENYGIDANKKCRHEIGGSVQFSSEYAYKKKISAESTLLFFSNYTENPENIDIDWNTSITYNLSRIFAISFTLDMLYDDDVDILLSETADGTEIYGKRLQIKEFLGFGLTYRLM